MLQLVIELDLADYPTQYEQMFDFYQFHRMNHEQIQQLEPNTYVRLRVGNYLPMTAAGYAWMREDLIWQITAKNTYVLEEWRKVLEGVPIAQF